VAAVNPQQFVSDLAGEFELAAALQGAHDLGHERCQALAGGLVQRGPHDSERSQDLPAVRAGLGGLPERFGGSITCARARIAWRRDRPVSAQSSSRIGPRFVFENPA
jgi:hypothetical protein